MPVKRSKELVKPFYARAEEIDAVHGAPGEDPAEPPRSGPFPFPAVPHEPYIDDLRAQLRTQRLHPFHYPMGIDLREGGRCIRGKTCDGFPRQVLAKSEGDVNCVRPAVESPNITLWTKTLMHRLLTDETGKRVVGVELERNGEQFTVQAGRFAVACGAVNSALLLMRSATDKHPNGLANSSGLLLGKLQAEMLTAAQPLVPKPILQDWLTAAWIGG